MTKHKVYTVGWTWGLSRGSNATFTLKTGEGFLFDITLPEICLYKVCYLYLDKAKTRDHVRHLSLEMLQAPWVVLNREGSVVVVRTHSLYGIYGTASFNGLDENCKFSKIKSLHLSNTCCFGVYPDEPFKLVFLIHS